MFSDVSKSWQEDHFAELTKLVVVCNYCSGLTNSNYTELSQLYEKYKDQGEYLIYDLACSFTTECLFWLSSAYGLVPSLWVIDWWRAGNYVTAGFEILAFPCNQFGGQEPGTNEEIVQFACTRFKAEYPIFDKVNLCIILLPFLCVSGSSSKNDCQL
jgi:glutathione peroxidase